jgi:cobalt/nickel transport system permease protein
MAAILAIQALVFQDGGVLALGPNIINMALAGVLAGYLPFHFWGGGRRRKLAIFAGGTLSVLVSGILAVAELAISHVPITGAALWLSLAVFLAAGAVEGAITVGVIAALERIQPGFVQKPREGRSFALGFAGVAALLLVTVGILFASTAPDTLQKVAEETGIAAHAQALVSTPFAGYQTAFIRSEWWSKAAAGLAGLGLISAACLAIGWVMARRRRA